MAPALKSFAKGGRSVPWHRVGPAFRSSGPPFLNQAPHNTHEIGMENQIILGEAVVRANPSPKDLTSVDRALPKMAVWRTIRQCWGLCVANKLVSNNALRTDGKCLV